LGYGEQGQRQARQVLLRLGPLAPQVLLALQQQEV